LSQAAAAQDQCEIYGTNKVLAIVDIDPGSRQAAPNDTTGVRGLMTALKTNNQPRIKKELTGLFRALRDSKPTVKAYRGFLMEIVMALGSVIRNMDLPDERFNLLVRDLMALPLPEAAQELFEGLMNEMSEEIVAVREKAGRRIAFDAIDYLRAHYHDENLSIETICRILYVSSSYFSSVFKKETGQTFLQYLTDLRMSSALSILAQGERPINEVAKAVGFSDPSYFSYVFKKHYGLPPSQVSQFQQEEA
jgi:two-component system response regulator YesN